MTEDKFKAYAAKRNAAWHAYCAVMFKPYEVKRLPYRRYLDAKRKHKVAAIMYYRYTAARDMANRLREGTS